MAEQYWLAIQLWEKLMHELQLYPCLVGEHKLLLHLCKILGVISYHCVT